MFKRSDNRNHVFLQRATNSKEIVINSKKIMNMKIVTNFKACIIGLYIVDL